MSVQERESGESSVDRRPRYVHTGSWPELISSLGICIAATTYQAGHVLAFSAVDGRSSLLIRAFPHPMGLAVAKGYLGLLSRNQVWEFINQPDLVDRSGGRVPYDAYYVPRRSHVTGDIAGHEIAWGRGEDGIAEMWVVNTRFSCLCTLHPRWSFVPRWRPPFITEIQPGDRCHLNGLAMGFDGRPRYVTALGETNETQGWREGRACGGCLIDVESGEVVARGLSMPHSPRLFRGHLWVLESGTGDLQTVDPTTGKRETVIRLPGFLRGLSFFGDFAFVGLSQARESGTFGDLPLQRSYDELRCGIHAIDLRSGQSVAHVDFQATVQELFDVQVVPGVRRINVVGFAKDTIDGIFVVPPGTTDPGAVPDRLTMTADSEEAEESA